MPAAYPVTATETSPQVATAVYSTRRVVRMLPQIPAALIPQVAQCSRRVDQTLTRGEMAVVFDVSARTVARWEIAYGLMPVRKNARVLRYELVDVVGLVALGVTLNKAGAEVVGLHTRAILDLAAAVSIGRVEQSRTSAHVSPLVLIAVTDDDQRLIAAWHDQHLGPVLRRIVRGLTAPQTET